MQVKYYTILGSILTLYITSNKYTDQWHKHEWQIIALIVLRLWQWHRWSLSGNELLEFGTPEKIDYLGISFPSEIGKNGLCL